MYTVLVNLNSLILNIPELSKQKKEIVKVVAKGMRNKEISDIWWILDYTVTTLRLNIDIRNPAGLTIYAIVNGLIDISEVK